MAARRQSSVPPTKTPPSHISKDDKEYNAKLIERVSTAQAMRAEIAKIEAAVQSWTDHLTAKYDLKEGDGVDASGKIIRQ